MSQKHLSDRSAPRAGSPRAWRTCRRTARALAASLAITSTIILVFLGFSGEDGVALPPARPAAPGAKETRAAPVHKAARSLPGAASKPLAHGFRPGDVLGYAFSSRRAVRLDEVKLPGHGIAAGDAHGASVTTEVSGILTVRVHDEDEKGWLCSFELSGVKTRFHSSELEDAAPMPAAALAGETAAVLSRQGMIEKLYFPAGMGPEGRNILRDLLASWQVVLPEAEPHDQWTTTEDDTTGSYRARYTCRRQGGRFEITKAKEEYVTLRAHGAGSGEATPVVSGRAAVTIEQHPTRIEGHERVELRSVHFVEAIESEAAYSFELRSRDFSQFDAAAMKARLASMMPATIAASEKGMEITRSPEGADIHAVLAEAVAFVDTGSESGGLHALMMSLVDALRIDPLAVDAVMALLADPSTGDDLAAMLIGALGSAATDPAQLGLEQVLREKSWPLNRQEMALYSLAQGESPRFGLDDTLLAVFEEGGPLAENSLRLLGAVGSRMRTVAPDRAAAVESHLLDRLADPALDDRSRLAVLHAVRNLGPEATPAALATAFEAGAERIRRAAVQALVSCRDDAAEALLRRAAEGDPSEAVRLAAVDVLGRGALESAPGLLTKTLLEDRSEAVRERALSALARVAPEDASVRATLQHVARQDPSGPVRELATELLDGSRSS